MAYQLRPYQAEAVEAAVDHFRNGKGNGLIVAPTAAGKSLYIAGIAHALGEPVLIFQPNKEILEQNYSKMVSYGHSPAIFSASAGKKQVAPITFATIGSAKNKPDLFRDFKYVIVDEAHTWNPYLDKGMYQTFLTGLGAKVVGLTATPYLLRVTKGGPELRFLTRTRPTIFHQLLHHAQVMDLSEAGFLAPTEYFRTKGIDPEELLLNSSGTDYTDASVKAAFMRHDLEAKVLDLVARLLRHGRKSILVFTRFVKEAQAIADFLGDQGAFVSGETPKAERERILRDFQSGRIKVVANVMVLGIGFDFPALDTVILANPTKSLSRYYQWIGRVLRPHASKKSAYIVDLCGNINAFGKVEDLVVSKDHKGLWCVKSGHKQLTNIPYMQRMTQHT